MSAVATCLPQTSQSVSSAARIAAISSRLRTASPRCNLVYPSFGPTVKSTRWPSLMLTDSWAIIRRSYVGWTRTRAEFKSDTMRTFAYGIPTKNLRLSKRRRYSKTKSRHISVRGWGEESMQHVFVAGSFTMPTTRRRSMNRWEMCWWKSQFADLNVLWYWTSKMWLYWNADVFYFIILMRIRKNKQFYLFSVAGFSLQCIL